MDTTRTARVLIRKEPASDGQEWYVAQVLEYDIATQARSMGELMSEIERIMLAHIVCSEENGLDPFDVPPAPKPYHDEYVASKGEVTLNIQYRKSVATMKHAAPQFVARFASGV
jgi:hypothetical protein